MSYKEKTTCLPTRGAAIPCPQCKTPLIYPRWARVFPIIWVVYFFALFTSFFATMGSGFSGELFGALLYGLLPLAFLVFVAFAWGFKLTEVKSSKHRRSEQAAADTEKPAN